MSDKRSLVLKIHETPSKAVIALTGGGAEVIGELLRYGKGSNTVLEASVPYDQKSFDTFVKGTPDKYCSSEAARDLAMASFQRAIIYHGVNLEINHEDEHLIGVGVSCSLAKENERKGREHVAYIAIQTASYTRTLEFNFTKENFKYSREEEEELVARITIAALASASGLNEDEEVKSVFNNVHVKSHLVKDQYYYGSLEMYRLLTGFFKSLTINEMGNTNHTTYPENRIIFSGAFNPFHDGHKQIAERVSTVTGKPVDLEICVHNVDKPIFNYTNFTERIVNLSKQKDEPWCGDIHYTSLPTFLQKAEYFYGATFVVGWDTFKRISDPKYGNVDKVLETLNRQSVNFIVFHRISNGVNSVDEGLQGIDPRFLKISQIIPPEILIPTSVSSSELRKNLTGPR